MVPGCAPAGLEIFTVATPFAPLTEWVTPTGGALDPVFGPPICKRFPPGESVVRLCTIVVSSCRKSSLAPGACWRAMLSMRVKRSDWTVWLTGLEFEDGREICGVASVANAPRESKTYKNMGRFSAVLAIGAFVLDSLRRRHTLSLRVQAIGYSDIRCSRR
jgi:hypothetical protein